VQLDDELLRHYDRASYEDAPCVAAQRLLFDRYTFDGNTLLRPAKIPM
jgi:hypothetical protein